MAEQIYSNAAMLANTLADLDYRLPLLVVAGVVDPIALYFSVANVRSKKR